MNRRLPKYTATLTCIILFIFAIFAHGQEPRSETNFGVMGTAKVLCSAVSVSGRDLEEALLNSASTFLPEDDWKLLVTRADRKSDVNIKLDRKAGMVRWYCMDSPAVPNTSAIRAV